MKYTKSCIIQISPLNKIIRFYSTGQTEQNHWTTQKKPRAGRAAKMLLSESCAKGNPLITAWMTCRARPRRARIRSRAARQSLRRKASQNSNRRQRPHPPTRDLSYEHISNTTIQSLTSNNVWKSSLLPKSITTATLPARKNFIESKRFDLLNIRSQSEKFGTFILS